MSCSGLGEETIGVDSVCAADEVWSVWWASWLHLMYHLFYTIE